MSRDVQPGFGGCGLHAAGLAGRAGIPAEVHPLAVSRG
jgi:hypothetical protein